MIYPWHKQAWRQLAQNWHKRPNGWLFTGKEGTGKTAFARFIAQALLCETPQPDQSPCGQCSSCHLFAQNSHPDFFNLAPEIPEGENSGRRLQQIKIDAVREVLDHLYLSSLRGGCRVVLVSPAESMNIQAANAMLKALEEPPEQVVFLLVSHARDKLLPTIKSRCRQMVLPCPSQQEALAFLQEKGVENAEQQLAFHSNAPLFEIETEQEELRAALLNFLAEPRLLLALDYAAQFDRGKLPLAMVLDWLQKWLIDVGLAQRQMSSLYYPQYHESIARTAEQTDAFRLFSFADSLNKLVPYGYHTLSVRMQLESLLCLYIEFWKKR